MNNKSKTILVLVLENHFWILLTVSQKLYDSLSFCSLSYIAQYKTHIQASCIHLQASDYGYVMEQASNTNSINITQQQQPEFKISSWIESMSSRNLLLNCTIRMTFKLYACEENRTCEEYSETEWAVSCATLSGTPYHGPLTTFHTTVLCSVGLAFKMEGLEGEARGWCSFHLGHPEIAQAGVAMDAKVISICSSCHQPFCWFPQWTVNLTSVLLTLYCMRFSRTPSWKAAKWIWLTVAAVFCLLVKVDSRNTGV